VRGLNYRKTKLPGAKMQETEDLNMFLHKNLRYAMQKGKEWASGVKTRWLRVKSVKKRT
jgi:uncharacterized protein YqiB (DUF1249 family)